MDPLTAFLNTVTAITEMITEIVKGQSPEVKKQMWDWYVADVKNLRKLLNISDA